MLYHQDKSRANCSYQHNCLRFLAHGELGMPNVDLLGSRSRVIYVASKDPMHLDLKFQSTSQAACK